ncbi:MAG: hypothetical protein HC884_13370 [Chloroflexaceae bacterium]|nr:hypothetical protein [Chloroflexaceae bacterium]
MYRLSEVWKVGEDQTLVGWLTRTVKSWDLTVDDEPLALSKEAMERALGDEDLALLRAVETAIREDATYPNLRTVKAA